MNQYIHTNKMRNEVNFADFLHFVFSVVFTDLTLVWSLSVFSKASF